MVLLAFVALSAYVGYFGPVRVIVHGNVLGMVERERGTHWNRVRVVVALGWVAGTLCQVVYWGFVAQQAHELVHVTLFAFVEALEFGLLYFFKIDLALGFFHL